ncbi:hypothetical protein BDZ89DRAFT_213252 [Hymenopellis radicata]|nr:hypothetical protein BDZ89DRAFT_213252 [Hymenopellis radicata]
MDSGSTILDIPHRGFRCVRDRSFLRAEIWFGDHAQSCSRLLGDNVDLRWLEEIFAMISDAVRCRLSMASIGRGELLDALRSGLGKVLLPQAWQLLVDMVYEYTEEIDNEVVVRCGNDPRVSFICATIRKKLTVFTHSAANPLLWTDCIITVLSASAFSPARWYASKAPVSMAHMIAKHVRA